MKKRKKRIRHHFAGNIGEQAAYRERCTRCGLVVRYVQTPKERRRYCPTPKPQTPPGRCSKENQP